MNYKLKPLKRPGKARPYSVFDIESRNWIEFVTIGHFDGKTFTHHERMKDFLEHVFAHEHDTLFAHFGGGFDFQFVMETFLEDHRRYHLIDLKDRDSGMLSFTLLDRKTKRKLTFRDTYAFLPFSLKTLAHDFETPHQKLEWDHKKTTNPPQPELLTYLDNDCQALYEVIQSYWNMEHIQQVGPKFTFAGQSLKLYQRYHRKETGSLARNVDRFVRNAYGGGKTEIYRPIYEDKETPLYGYDLNSNYAYLMSREEMPILFSHYSYRPDLSLMGFCEATVEVPETYLPTLWVKDYLQPETQKKERKFIFPTGRFSGTWPTSELRDALSQGAKILKLGRMAVFKSDGIIFKDFCEDIYAERLKWKAWREKTFPDLNRSSVQEMLFKKYPSATYGRMGLKREQEKIVIDQGQKGIDPRYQFRVGDGSVIQLGAIAEELKGFSNVAVSAWITGLARLLLLSWQRQCEPYMSDTDSIYTPTKLPTSSELGALKLEEETFSACFLQPKGYATDHKTKLKGFDNAEHWRYQDFKRAFDGELCLYRPAGEPKFARWKSALRENGRLLALTTPSGKGVKELYNKRVLFRDERGKWDSRPIHLQN